MLDLKAQYATYKAEALAAIAEVCDSQLLALGPAVAEFEQSSAAYVGCRHAIGVSSGTDALLLSLMALGIGPGDEVITTPFTFFSTAGSIVRVGARPVFVDIDPATYNINPDFIEDKITDRTRAIIPVHLFGQAARMRTITEIAQRHGLSVIEDAAQAIGSSQDGTKCGALGDMACFSFYPTKNLGAFGDGGLLTTDDDVLAEKVTCLRNHGQTQSYVYKFVGGNFRLDGIQAAVLGVKLGFLEEWNTRRRQHAAMYDELLADSPVRRPWIERGNVTNYHQYTIAASRRDALKQHLADNGIGSAIFYPLPIHLQECFGDLGYAQGDLPVAEKCAQEVLSLPIYAELRPEQVAYVAETILGFYKGS